MLIRSGSVRVHDQVADKPGTTVPKDTPITLDESPAYVSRGGIKLRRALAEFQVEVAGRIALDVGAATGGFTDCLLQHGAARIYAVDVGYGQFDWRLRQDERVRLLERTNARYLNRERLYGIAAGGGSLLSPAEKARSTPMAGARRAAEGEASEAVGDAVQLADLAVIDVSFISLTKIIPNVLQLLAPRADILALVKPQFEAGRSQVGKKGVVRLPEVHRAVLTSLCDWIEAGLGGQLTLGGEFPSSAVHLACLTYSPLRGPEGNIEFWMYLRRDNEGAAPVDLGLRIGAVVEEAHRNL